MELIYEDMNEHKEAYPMDIVKRKNPIKYLDFREVVLQEKFFEKNENALELPKEFVPNDDDNIIKWQPGDIVYFQVDPDNPNRDLGGFISRYNNNNVPLVIMISKEFGKISEVEIDKLQEYTIVGHYRYPYTPPEVD